VRKKPAPGPSPRALKAPQAAGVIHGDFERGFIAAQIVHFDDLITLGSEAKAREAGKLRIEGKEYVMRDGDVVMTLISGAEKVQRRRRSCFPRLRALMLPSDGPSSSKPSTSNPVRWLSM
jgi:hypothetical protein